jgi:type II secretory pathway pseudopilin PulG
MTRRVPKRRKSESGFTLTEMLIATVVVIFGLVAVAQLVPASVMMNSNNRNDGTALVFAQKQMDFMRAQPLSVLSFTDSQGIFCPSGQTCQLGDPTQPLQQIGCPVVLSYNSTPVLDFSQSAANECTSGYYSSYTDPNDPFNATYDVRWNVITNVNQTTNVVISRRILLGVFRRGMETPTLPITLDVQVEK